MSRKKWLLSVFSGMVLLLLTGCLRTDEATTRTIDHSNHTGSYEVIRTMDDLARRSAGAVEVRRTGRVLEAKHHQYPELITVIHTEFEVIRSITDDSLAPGDVIFIEEIEQFAYLPYEKHEHYLFFLYPTYGDMRVRGVTGGYQGAFKIKQNRVVYDADQYGGVNLFQKELNDMKKEEAISQIEAVFQKIKKEK